MPTYKLKAFPLVAKMLSLRRKTTNPQHPKQTDSQMDEVSETSGDTSDSKDLPSKEESLPENDKARRWKRYVLYRTGSVLKILLAVLLVCTLYGIFPVYTSDQEEPHDSGVKVIMLWNEALARMPKGSRHMECGCVVTSRRKDFELPVDAFVFNVHRHYSLSYLPKINRSRNFLSVFAARDALSRAKVPPLPPAGSPPLFNLTMTYRPGSQLVWLEYYFSNLNQAARVDSFRAPSEHYEDNMPAYEMELLEKQIKTKDGDGLVLYILYEVDDSNFPKSLYLMELRKYMTLHAHVSCINYERCNQYYFMLVFESSTCPDYVPAQMYEAMYMFVVPVLIGGGNLAHLLPPHSYISSRDFPRPQDLAAHMKHLQKTPEEYKRYFWWHSLYKLRRTALPYCQLCKLLKQPPRERRLETSFADWWTKNQCPRQITSFL